MSTFDFSTYLSQFTWKYSSSQMRKIFSEENKIRLWRKVWVALARAQHEAGLVNKKELDDLIKHESEIDVERAYTIEKEIHHDVMGAVLEFGEKAKIGKGKIHLGATSMDISENADMVRIHEAIKLIEDQLKTLLKSFAKKIDEEKNTVCIGFTHLQTAEPTTVGYRLSLYAQDLLNDYHLLQFVKKDIKGKGMRGAVGTSASYKQLLNNSKTTASDLNQMVMKQLGIESTIVSSQTYPRKFDYFVLTLLASIAQSLYKFAADLRILQSPMVGEWMEPFGQKQVGSSAMPFKKNPINAERICGLGRYVGNLPNIAWENAAQSFLERTLDDYIANRRSIIAEGFLAVDEMTIDAQKIIDGLIVNHERIKLNLQTYGPFAATEVILMESVKKGADRQKMHKSLREISMKAWTEIQKGNNNPMEDNLINSNKINNFLKPNEIKKLLDVSNHIGDAPQRAAKLISEIKKI